MSSVVSAEMLSLSHLLFRALMFYFIVILVSYIMHRIGISRASKILSTLYAFVTSQNYVTSVWENRLPSGRGTTELEDGDTLNVKSFTPEVMSLVSRFNTDLLLVFVQLVFVWVMYLTSSLWFFPNGYEATSVSVLWFLQHAELPFVVIVTAHHIFWGTLRLRSLTRIVVIWVTEVNPYLIATLPFLRNLDRRASKLRAGVISSYIFLTQQKNYPAIIYLAPLGVVIVALLWVFLGHFGLVSLTLKM